MLKLYIFISDNYSDKCSIISVFARTPERADKLVNKKFIDWNYKGKPQRIAI